MLDFAVDFERVFDARLRKETEFIVSFVKNALTALKRVLIVIGIAAAFTLGLLGAIYLSLRSSETKVPDIVGKDRTAAETTISSAGLNFRVRATRASSEAKPDTVLIQLPHAGEIVKVGQTVAVDISRASKAGEDSTIPTSTNTNTENTKKPENANASNSNANANSNKPTNRNRNSNANANANRNGNARANQNLNANANRATTENTNANSNETPAHNANTIRPNVNINRRPAVVTPTPQF